MLTNTHHLHAIHVYFICIYVNSFPNTISPGSPRGGGLGFIHFRFLVGFSCLTVWIRTRLELLSFEFDIIAISENKIIKDIDPNYDINLPGYHDPFSIPTESTKGGVMIYCKDTISSSSSDIFYMGGVRATLAKRAYLDP